MPRLTAEYFADSFQRQAEHWRACYHRMIGKKLDGGRIVRGHVATPPNLVRDNETWRGLARYWRRVANDVAGPAAIVERLERDGVTDAIENDIDRERELVANRKELIQRRAEIVVLRGALRQTLEAMNQAASADEVYFQTIAADGILAKVGADIACDHWPEVRQEIERSPAPPAGR